MSFNIYVGSTGYDIDTDTQTNLGYAPDFTDINYRVTTYLPGEFLVNVLRNVGYDTSNNTPIQLSNGYSFNLYDVPVDIGMNRCDLSTNFTDSDTDDIVVDAEHSIPFNKSNALVASVIPKVFGSQFPFTQGIDHNVRNFVPESTLKKYSKFSLKNYGFYSNQDQQTISLQGLIRSKYSLKDEVLDADDSSEQQGHRVIDALYNNFTDWTNYWTISDGIAKLNTLPDAINLQFVLRLSLSYQNVNMKSDPNFMTTFDEVDYDRRVLILYNFVFVPDMYPQPLPVATGTAWTSSSTLTPSNYVMSGNSSYLVSNDSNNIYYEDSSTGTTQTIEFSGADTIEISGDGNTLIVGDSTEGTLKIYRNTSGTMTLTRNIPTNFSDVSISDNGSIIAIGNKNTGIVTILHDENAKYKSYFLKQYTGTKDIKVEISASGSEATILQTTEKSGGTAFVNNIYNLSYDGQSWTEMPRKPGLITTADDDTYGMDMSASTGLFAYNRQSVDVRTDPATITRYVEVYSQFSQLPTIYGEPGDSTFGKIIRLGTNSNRIAIAGDNDTKIFDYDGTQWTQLGDSLPTGTNIVLSDDGGTILIDNELFSLN
jgi:hypothetical protein